MVGVKKEPRGPVRAPDPDIQHNHCPGRGRNQGDHGDDGEEANQVIGRLLVEAAKGAGTDPT